MLHLLGMMSGNNWMQGLPCLSWQQIRSPFPIGNVDFTAYLWRTPMLFMKLQESGLA